MPPSYPNWKWESNLSIRFVVPNKRVVYKIFEDSEEEEVLRKKAAGMILYGQVKILARVLSRYRIQVDSVTPNELEIVLFLPPPPCPPPKATTTEGGRKQYASRPQLDTIPEEQITEDEAQPKYSPSGTWITLYEYMPCRE